MTVSSLGKPLIAAYKQTSLNYTPFDCKWISGTAKLLCIGQTVKSNGIIQVYRISDDGLIVDAELPTDSGIKCCSGGSFITVAANETSYVNQRLLSCGSFDGSLNVYDLESPSGFESVFSARAHSSIVNCIDSIGGHSKGLSGSFEIVTANKEVKLWDVRAPSSVAEFSSSTATPECWAVAFGNAFNQTDRCVAAGYSNGDLKLYDLKAMKVRYETNLSNGIVGLQFDRPDIEMNKLVSVGLESEFNVFDMRTFHPTEGYSKLCKKLDTGSTLWWVKHLPQNREIFMVSAGNFIQLYQYHYPSKRSEQDSDGNSRGIMGTVEQLNFCDVAEQPVNSFSWSPDKLGLCCYTSFDQQLRVGFVTRLEGR